MDQAGEPLVGATGVLAQQASEQRGLSIAKPNLRLDLARRERREVLAGNVHVLSYRAVLNRQLEDHIAVEGDSRRDDDC
jgi:hypothetical protein